MIEIPPFLSVLSLWDVAGATYLFACWLFTGWFIEKRPGGGTSTGALMAKYRSAWFHETSQRSARIFDATLLTSLRNSSTFFASASLAALGAAIALLGQTDELAHVATDLVAELSVPRTAWIVKLIGVIIILAAGFLHFVWAHRVFGYCIVLMGALPNDTNSPDREAMVERLVGLNVAANRIFNRGLRAMYFALAALAWLIGTWALFVAVTLTAAMTFRHEFRSHTRSVLLKE